MGPEKNMAEKGKVPTVAVKLDGKPIDAAVAGKNVVNGMVRVDSEMLYELVDLRGSVDSHTLDITTDQPGLAIYAFTFGK